MTFSIPSPVMESALASQYVRNCETSNAVKRRRGPAVALAASASSTASDRR
jgi:hypothetical protein